MLTAEVLPFPATAEPLAALEAEREVGDGRACPFSKTGSGTRRSPGGLAAVDAEQARLDEAMRASPYRLGE